jgi:hypothetical protein
MASLSSRPKWQLPDRRVHPAIWVGVAAVMIWSDYAGGLRYFPVLYVIPVTLAAWFSGRLPAVVLATIVPIVRLMLISFSADATDSIVPSILETLARGVVVLFLALWIARLAELERALERRVRILEGMLPICAFCKKIRNDGGEWERLEGYIMRRSEAQFSHSICPTCCEEHYAHDLADAAAQ